MEWRGTYSKDGHAAGADDGQGQAIGAQGEGDEGEHDDGELDPEEPDRLGRRNADGDETFCAHGDGGCWVGLVGWESRVSKLFVGVVGWSRVERRESRLVHTKKPQTSQDPRRREGDQAIFIHGPCTPARSSFRISTPPDHRGDAMAATNGGGLRGCRAVALATRRD